MKEYLLYDFIYITFKKKMNLTTVMEGSSKKDKRERTHGHKNSVVNAGSRQVGGGAGGYGG